MLHACTCLHAMLSVSNPEWALIAPGGTFLFPEKNAWFSKNTAANSDDFNVCIRIVYSIQV